MKITRRDLLHAGAGVAALTLVPRFTATRVHAQPATAPTPRMRWEDFIQVLARLAAFKRGVAVMKSRKPSDPTSWFFQSAIHAVTPELVDAATQIDPDVARVDQARFWNRCPHSNAEHSADFLIWHRAYLYYFEHILRAAAQDPTLSLPYWNYTEPGQRGFLREFARQEIDPMTQLPGNPLFDHRREQAFMFGLYQLSEGVVSTAPLFNEVNFFGATEDAGFAGGVADNDGSTKGLIEQRPHDLLHFAIGGSIGTGEIDAPGGLGGLMASVPTAAFDPIFWVHHANIDRLWTVWECLDTPPRRWGHVPPREWLEERPWSFHDFDLSIVEETRLYYLDRRNLVLAYDTDDPACTPLSASDPRDGDAPGVEEGVIPIPPNIRTFVPTAEAGRLAQPVRVSPFVARTLVVPLAQMPELGNQDVTEAIEEAPPAAPRRLLLELHDLVVEGVTSVGFDVYVVLGDGGPLDRTAPNFVGTVALFGTLPGDMLGRGDGAEMAGMAGMGVQRFDITSLTLLEGFDPTQIRIQIVPFDLLTPVEGQPRLRRRVGFTVGEVRIVVAEGVAEGVVEP